MDLEATDSDPPLPPPGLTQRIHLRGPDGMIEGLISAPRTPAPVAGVALLCHPHPLFGGTQDNKVVYTLAASAAKSGLYALRFNFRGVGASEGAHDHGRGETADAVFLARWLLARVPGARLVLGGFSFGGWVALRAAAQLQPAALVTVAPPLGKYEAGLAAQLGLDAAPPPQPACPWLLIHAEDDDVVDYATTQQAATRYASPPQWVGFAQGGHFFHGRLTELDQLIRPFIMNAVAA